MSQLSIIMTRHAWWTRRLRCLEDMLAACTNYDEREILHQRIARAQGHINAAELERSRVIYHPFKQPEAEEGDYGSD